MLAHRDPHLFISGRGVKVAASDLKSAGSMLPCRFESDRPHHIINASRVGSNPTAGTNLRINRAVLRVLPLLGHFIGVM